MSEVKTEYKFKITVFNCKTEEILEEHIIEDADKIEATRQKIEKDLREKGIYEQYCYKLEMKPIEKEEKTEGILPDGIDLLPINNEKTANQ